LTVFSNHEEIKGVIAKACHKANRNCDEVNIIAVTKYVSLETTNEAIEAGITHLGENRIEGFSEKYEKFKGKAKFHFIGTLQSRKVKEVVDHIDYLHSLDRLSLAKEIEKRATKEVKCFIQVNVSGEDSKHGLLPEELKTPHIEDKEQIRSYFQKLKQLQLDVQAMKLPNVPCSELSMGMSNDYEVAIEEGATFVRIGSALVGKEF
jgi:PLP dependent protein